MPAKAHIKLPSPAVGDDSWMTRAACKGQDPEIYDESFSKNVGGDIRCFQCLVRAQCLSYAVENRYDGIWGGTTKYRRDQMTRRRRIRVQCPRDDCLSTEIRNTETYGTCISCGMRWNIPRVKP
jgi:hypothetical protein